VLNPLFLIPYVLAPMVNVLIGYLAIAGHIVPIFRYAIGSSAPVLLDGIIATGDVMGAVLQLVWLSVDIIIYTPFVIIFNLMDDAKTDREEELISDAQEVRNL
jgi:PTS system cellobiose-specific IIC component